MEPWALNRLAEGAPRPHGGSRATTPGIHLPPRGRRLHRLSASPQPGRGQKLPAAGSPHSHHDKAQGHKEGSPAPQTWTWVQGKRAAAVPSGKRRSSARPSCRGGTRTPEHLFKAETVTQAAEGSPSQCVAEALMSPKPFPGEPASHRSPQHSPKHSPLPPRPPPPRPLPL